jgi:hypothetical protein
MAPRSGMKGKNKEAHFTTEITEGAEGVEGSKKAERQRVRRMKCPLTREAPDESERVCKFLKTRGRLRGGVPTPGVLRKECGTN